MPDGAKGGFNRVTGPDALPVLGRKIIERQQFIPILVQTQRGFRVFRFVGVNKQIKRRVGIFPGLCLPDGVQGLLAKSSWRCLVNRSKVFRPVIVQVSSLSTVSAK